MTGSQTGPAVSAADRTFAGLQACLPQHTLSRTMHWLARREIPALVLPAIRAFIAAYGVRMDEAAQPDPGAYRSFNAFFTRTLRPGARPLPADPRAIASPVDGTVSARTSIDGDRLLQVKGRTYRLSALLADQPDLGERFHGGEALTIYLAPRDYHRIHVPLDARLQRMIYVPGDLFAVNPRTTRAVDGLFARNERLICVFETAAGLCAVILVGAIFVGSMSTVWTGEVTPARTRVLTTYDGATWGHPQCRQGDELGQFNMGSTVILLFEPNRLRWRANLEPGAIVKMGEAIANRV